MRDSQTAPELWPGETQADYERIRAGWESAYDRNIPANALLVESLIEADRWQRHTMHRLLSAERTLAAADLAKNLKEIESARQGVDFAMRAQNNAERSFQRALRNVEQVAARRNREETVAQTVATRDAHMALSMHIRCFLAEVPEDLLKKWISVLSQSVDQAVRQSTPDHPGHATLQDT